MDLPNDLISRKKMEEKQNIGKYKKKILLNTICKYIKH